ncbi:SEC-C metal-binding domain-containing protein, partial [Delftia acidovorans]
MITVMRDDVVSDLVRQYVPAESMEEQWDLAGLEKALESEWRIQLPLQSQVQSAHAITDEEILEKVLQAAREVFDAKVELIGRENFTQFQRAVLLQSFDTNWRDHLSALDYLRQGIHLRGYAQKQPKQEYKREAFELFRQLIDQVKTEVTRVLMTVQVQSREQVEQATEALEQRSAHSLEHMTYGAPSDGDIGGSVEDEPLELPEGARVGRNDPCPCGSGKKYKQCHGKLS